MAERALVTGGGGFLGRHLVWALVAETSVVSLDVVAATGTGGGGSGRAAVPTIRCDLRDAAGVLEACRAAAADTVHHLAGVLALPAERDPATACAVNIQGTLHVLEAARQAGVRRVVLASSVAVYGSGGRGRITEEAPLRPELMYGATKVAGEALAAYYAARHGLDVRILRLPSVLGPDRAGESVTGNYSRILQAAAAGQPFEVRLAPETRVPLIYVKDAVRALMMLAAAPAACLRRPAYHVTGFTPPLTLAGLVEAIGRRLPHASVTFRVDPAAAGRLGYLAGLELDDAAARADWGWSPEFDADRMVADVLASGDTAG